VRWDLPQRLLRLLLCSLLCLLWRLSQLPLLLCQLLTSSNAAV
jgi:hypothetical protein